MIRKLILAIALVITPTVSQSLQLQWASGSPNLTFTETTRCTLIVRADPGESPLPAELRLAWVATNCAQIAVVVDTSAADPSIAQVTTVGAQSAAQARAHASTAFMHAASAAAEARWIMDLPAGAAGKFQVVAQTTDSAGALTVVRSLIATFNGGVAAPFGPIVTSATSDHETSRLVVTVTGAGLGSNLQATVVAADTSWQVPLQVTENSDNSLTAVADVPALLPASVLDVTAASSLSRSQAPLDADPSPPAAPTFTGPVLLSDPDNTVAMKDFAFVYNVVPKAGGGWQGLYHVIYIRRQINGVEVSYGHATSTDLQNWTYNTSAYSVFPDVNAWDHGRLLAPTLIKVGPLWYLVYSAEDKDGNQSIGYATTALLGDAFTTSWSRKGTPIYTANQPDWTLKTVPQQFRDPYVFPDPDAGPQNPRYLMVYTAFSANPGEVMNIGLARNALGTLDQWINLGYYRSTDQLNAFDGALESPHMVQDPFLPGHWRLFWTNVGGTATNSIHFQSNFTGHSVSDTTIGLWDCKKNLYAYLSNSSTVNDWRATEQLRVGVPALLNGQQTGFTDFLGAFTQGGIMITRMNWGAIVDPLNCDPQREEFTIDPTLAAVDPQSGQVKVPALSLKRLTIAAHRIDLAVSLPSPIKVRLGVYDVTGREVVVLADRMLPAGRTEFPWDCKTTAGTAARAGVYFARMAFPGGAQSVKVPIVR